LSGTMTLTFTGDERGGLTSREKVILLGFLVAQVRLLFYSLQLSMKYVK